MSVQVRTSTIAVCTWTWGLALFMNTLQDRLNNACKVGVRVLWSSYSPRKVADGS